MAGPASRPPRRLLCPHGGPVTIVPANVRAMAGGAPIATAADTFIVAGCLFTLPGPMPSPCVRVQWIVPGLRVKVGGQALDAGERRRCASPRPARRRGRSASWRRSRA